MKCVFPSILGSFKRTPRWPCFEPDRTRRSRLIDPTAFPDDVVGDLAELFDELREIARIHYVVRAIDDEDRADAVVAIIEETGIETVDVADACRIAADFTYRHAPTLADAFALATAAHVDGTLLAGADDEYDDISDVAITRVRTDPA